MSDELLPCPFCGGKFIASDFDYHHPSRMHHEKPCILDGWSFAKTALYALDPVGLWNTRATTPPQDVLRQMVDALEEIKGLMDLMATGYTSRIGQTRRISDAAIIALRPYLQDEDSTNDQ